MNTNNNNNFSKIFKRKITANHSSNFAFSDIPKFSEEPNFSKCPHGSYVNVILDKSFSFGINALQLQ